MRRAVLILMPVLLLSSAVIAPAPLSASPLLTSALLTAADLPAGWRAEGAPSRISEHAWCPLEREGLAPLGRASVALAGGAVGPLVYHEVLHFSPAGAEQALAGARDGSQRCAWAETAADPEAMVFTLDEPQELPIGDEAVLRRLTARWESMVLEAHVVLIRRGELVAVLTHVTVGEGQAALDGQLTLVLAQRADARLSAALSTAARACG